MYTKEEQRKTYKKKQFINTHIYIYNFSPLGLFSMRVYKKTGRGEKTLFATLKAFLFFLRYLSPDLFCPTIIYCLFSF